MAERQLWVMVYDVVEDRRRARLHKALLAFRTPVQYSVFECWLTREQLAELKARVAKLIRPRKDHVRYCHLCAACQARASSNRGDLTKVRDAVIV